MTDSTPADSQEWPTHCPHCGTRLVPRTIDYAAVPDETDGPDEERATFRPGEMAAADFCPNPDCPVATP